MEISALFIRIVFLVFPGIVGRRLYRKLRGNSDQKAWEDFTEILVFALASYLLWSLLSWPLRDEYVIPALSAFLDENAPLDPIEIGAATVLALAVAAIGSLAHKKKWVSHVAVRLGVSNRSGDEDVWDFLHTMPASDWVFVRDHKLDLVYFGWVKSFSDPGKERELLLADVDVFTNTIPSRKLYSVAALYLSRDQYGLTIEIPGRGRHPADAGNRSGD